MEETEIFLREELENRFILKEKSIGSPDQCLGNKESQVKLENGVKFWSFSSSQYVQHTVNNAEDYCSRYNLALYSIISLPGLVIIVRKLILLLI